MRFIVQEWSLLTSAATRLRMSRHREAREGHEEGVGATGVSFVLFVVNTVP